MRRIPQNIFLEEKWVERETDNLLVSNFQINNAWNFSHFPQASLIT